MNVDQKIQELEARLNGIQTELQDLKSYVQLNAPEPVIPFNEQRNVTTASPQQNPSYVEPKQVEEPVRPKQNISNPIHTTPHREPKHTNSSRNLETLLGKYIMGIVASVLIFFGLILFGILIYRNFTDTLKMIALYGISMLLLTLGLLLNRKKDGPFFMSLIGCGLGAFFTSLILTYSYFHRINYITLYVLLVLWATAVLFTAHYYHSQMITVIGQLGVLIASLFGLWATNTSMEFLLIASYIVVGTLMFLIPQSKQQQTFVSYLLLLSDSFLILVGSLCYVQDSGYMSNVIADITRILLLGYNLFLIIYYLKKHLGNKLTSQILFPIQLLFFVISSGFLMYHFQALSFSDEMDTFIYLIWLFIVWIFVTRRKDLLPIRVISFIILYFPMILMYALELEDIRDWLGLGTFYLPFLIYGYIKKDTLYVVSGYVLYGISLVTLLFVPEHFLWLICLTGITLLILGALIYAVKELYRMEYKFVLYLYFVFYVIVSANGFIAKYDIIAEQSFLVKYVAFFVLCISTILLLYLGWCKNFVTKQYEKDTNLLLFTILQSYLAYGVSMCFSTNITTAKHLLLVLLLSVICCIGTKKIIQSKGKELGSLVLAMKYTVFTLLIFHSFLEHIDTITSIICFIIAILCILLGFCIDAKKLRIYGLILSMVAAFKLILIDIDYSNTMKRMISFFICGILCFLINFIYSFVAKKLERQKEDFHE